MKKILVILFLILKTSFSSAQTMTELNAQFSELFGNGDFVHAAEVMEKIVTEIKYQRGEENADYATALNKLGTTYFKLGQFNKAELPFIEATAIRKKIFGESNSLYEQSLYNLVFLYEKTKDNIKLEGTYIQALDSRKKIKGEDSLYVLLLDKLALLYYKTGNVEKEEQSYRQSIEIKKRIFGEFNLSYATSLNSLGLLYRDNGQFAKAEPLFLKVSEIRMKLLGANNEEYAKSLYNLAIVCAETTQYLKAEELYLQVLAIQKNLFGENHQSYSNTLTSMAILNQDMGRFSKAEQLFLKEIEIEKKINGELHPRYAKSMNNLASLYLDMNQYTKAEQLMLRAADIEKINPGELCSEYAIILDNMAVLYNKLGQYEKAESVSLKTCEIFKKTDGENSKSYAIALGNLANIYVAMKKYETALDYQVRTQVLCKKIYGENHLEYAVILSNLGNIYLQTEEFEKAESYFIEAFNIRKRLIGEDHPVIANSLNGLAFFYYKTGQYEKAEPLFLKAIEIWKKNSDERSSLYAIGLNNLAILYESTKQYAKAEPLLLQYSSIISHNTLNDFSALSDQEKGMYLKNNIGIIENENSLLYNYKQASPEFKKSNFNTMLLFKSLSLADTRNMVEAIRNSSDTDLTKDFLKWQDSKTVLSKQYALPVNRRSSDLKEIETKAEELEKKLNRNSAVFRNQQVAVRISLQDIQKKMKSDEVAVEFVQFLLYNKKWTDSIIYAAYVLHKNDSVPQFVPLCEQEQLGRYFSATGGIEKIKALYRSEVVDEDEKPSLSGDSLYALVWKPLQPYLQGVKKINYSPAGLLYKVAFHALPAGDSLLLMDKYELNQYVSTRQLALPEEKKTTSKSITLFGDCQFTMDSTLIVNTIASNEKVNTLITANISRGENAGGWKQLSGTADEIKSIQILFNKNKINTNAFTQATATEEQFKSLSGNSPSIIHLATHGFFLPDPEKKRQEGFAADERNAFTIADDPLLRSGIVLSGANRVWSGQPPIAGREDGIVTAYEIAQLDLSKTDLVVLSACETALGDIKGNEGVFGLQRAFKLAGVKNMLLSLWKVPDAETAELMKIFYTYYMQGKTARESFTAAQKDMRRKYKPYYWAAFVLIE